MIKSGTPRERVAEILKASGEELASDYAASINYSARGYSPRAQATDAFLVGYSAGRAEAVEKPNKVIQIALAAYQGMGLVALCEDGSLWFTERPYDIKMTWAQLPPPQDPK